jgi:hypothetical protein
MFRCSFDGQTLSQAVDLPTPTPRQNHRVVDPEEARACRVYGEHTRADMLGNGSFLKDFLAEHSYIDFAVSSYPLAWRDAYHPSGDPIAGRQASPTRS